MSDPRYLARHPDGGLRAWANARPGYWREFPMEHRRRLRRRIRRAIRAQAKRDAS